MSESTLSISYADLLAEVGGFLGYGVDSTAWNAAKLAEVDRYIQSGIRNFYYPPAVSGIPAGYEWSFLNPSATIDTIAADDAMDLPDALSRITGNLHFAPVHNCTPVTIISEGQMMALKARTTTNAKPKCAAVRSKVSDGASGQRLEIVFWPTPDAAYTLSYRYEAYSGKLTTAKPYPLGGMKHSELIIESCLAVAEQRANDERGAHTDRFAEMLVAGIEIDKKTGARFFGQMGENYETSGGRSRRNFGTTYPVTYKGETW
jgi:hypothetical protein